MSTPDFILKLREKIGHEHLLLPGVTAVVIKDVPAGAPLWAVPEVLMVKRADNGLWTPITGIVDPLEEPPVTATREVAEETGLKVQVAALLGVGQVGPITYPNGDEVSFVDTTFRCEVLPGTTEEPRIGDDESSDVGWFSIAQLPPTLPRFRLVIADAVAQLRHPAGFKPRFGYVKRT